MIIALRYALSPIQKTGIFPEKNRENPKLKIFLLVNFLCPGLEMPSRSAINRRTISFTFSLGKRPMLSHVFGSIKNRPPGSGYGNRDCYPGVIARAPAPDGLIPSARWACRCGDCPASRRAASQTEGMLHVCSVFADCGRRAPKSKATLAAEPGGAPERARLRPQAARHEHPIPGRLQPEGLAPD